MKIAFLGECMIELNGKPFGEMYQSFGGDTLNSAIYFSRSIIEHSLSSDVSVFYVTALGTDALSAGMLKRWQLEGIKTDCVLFDEARSPGLYLIQLDDQGERTFLYWRNQSAARYLLQHPRFAEIDQQLQKMDMIVLSGISLAILPDEDRAKLISALIRYKEQGVQIVFDSNYRPRLWPDDNGLTVQHYYQQVYALSDFALVTFDDEQLIWGDDSPEITLKRLFNAGAKNIVIKLGKSGCLMATQNEREGRLVPSLVVDNVVDTTSAGDSFNAGFLANYIAQLSALSIPLRSTTDQSILKLVNGKRVSYEQEKYIDMQQACLAGHQLAAKVIQHKGAIIPIESM